jgi:hypothetical protein
MSCSSITLWVGDIIVELKPLAMVAAKPAEYMSRRSDLLDSELDGMFSTSAFSSSASSMDELLDIRFADCLSLR